jgi:hypothetical protein
MMTTAIKTAAASKQVREPNSELTADELALVTGGTPSAVPKPPQVQESLSLSYSNVLWKYTEQGG